MTLAQVKQTLKRYAENVLIGQVNDALGYQHVASVRARFVGQWEWCVTLQREGLPSIYLEFGPTAVAENARAPQPLLDPDYGKVFVTRHSVETEGIDRIVQTSVGFGEVLAGLAEDDFRLRDIVIPLTETA